MEREQALRGLKKLMLKLPALRGQLQIMGARNSDLMSLCGAFDEASDMLDRLRSAGPAANKALLREYEQVCSDLEADVVRLCLKSD